MTGFKQGPLLQQAPDSALPVSPWRCTTDAADGITPSSALFSEADTFDGSSFLRSRQYKRGGPSILILQLPSFLYFPWIKNNIVLFTLTCYNMCIHNCRTHELLQDVLFHWSELLLLQILHQGGRKEERLQSAHTLKLKELLLNGVKMFVPMSYGQTTLSHALRPEPVLNIPETCWFVWIVNGKADSSNVFQGLCCAAMKMIFSI